MLVAHACVIDVKHACMQMRGLPVACWLLMHVWLMWNMHACKWRASSYLTSWRAVCYLVPENEEFAGEQDGSGKVHGSLRTGLMAQIGAQSHILLIPTPWSAAWWTLCEDADGCGAGAGSTSQVQKLLSCLHPTSRKVSNILSQREDCMCLCMM